MYYTKPNILKQFFVIVIVEPSHCMKICMQDTLKKCDKVTNSHPSFKSLLFTSLFLHGILLVIYFRKKYLCFELHN